VSAAATAWQRAVRRLAAVRSLARRSLESSGTRMTDPAVGRSGVHGPLLVPSRVESADSGGGIATVTAPPSPSALPGMDAEPLLSPSAANEGAKLAVSSVTAMVRQHQEMLPSDACAAAGVAAGGAAEIASAAESTETVGPTTTGPSPEGRSSRLPRSSYTLEPPTTNRRGSLDRQREPSPTMRQLWAPRTTQGPPCGSRGVTATSARIERRRAWLDAARETTARRDISLAATALSTVRGPAQKVGGEETQPSSQSLRSPLQGIAAGIVGGFQLLQTTVGGAAMLGATDTTPGIAALAQRRAQPRVLQDWQAHADG